MAPFSKFFLSLAWMRFENRSVLLFLFTSISVSYLLLKCRRLRFRSARFTYLPLNLLLEFTRECFCSRSCSWRRLAACFAVASSSGAYSSNVFSNFTALSFVVADFSCLLSSAYKSPLSLARISFLRCNSPFFVRNAIISVSFFFPENGIFSDFYIRFGQRIFRPYYDRTTETIFYRLYGVLF